MKKIQLFITGLFLVPVIWQPSTAQSLDPSFAPSSIYAPGTVYSALEQSDGKRVVAGAFNRVNGTAVSSLARFNADGSLDAAFQQNLGAASGIARVLPLANGQFLLTANSASGGTITAGGITRKSLLRLNADGTADVTFTAGTGATYSNGTAGYVEDVLPLSNGQYVVVGIFESFNGTAAGSIVRLTDTGAVDPTFNAGLGMPSADPERIVGLPNGQMLVCGYIYDYNGAPISSLIRLNASGSLDPSFAQPFDPNAGVDNLLVQPDGKILAAGGSMELASNATPISIIRLSADGNPDPSFSPPPALNVYGSVYTYGDNALRLQPDGKVLFIATPVLANTGIPGVGRLNANGSLDNSFQIGTGPNVFPTSLTLLASGKVLVGGQFTNFSGTLDRGLVQLTSSGALDPTFQPLLQNLGSIAAVVRQADGKLVAGGNFSEINGQPVRRLARFNADGTRDAAYTGNVGDPSINDLALQPDGRLLVATTKSVVRLQATGSPDNTFLADFGSSNPFRLLLQPDGRLLVGGTSLALNGSFIPQGLVRLLADGSRDNSFVLNSSGSNRLTTFQSMALQPNGKIVVAGRYIPTGSTSTTGNRTIVRLETTGAVDPTFTVGTITAPTPLFINGLAVQPDGKVLAAGNFSAVGTATQPNVARLNADGTLDAGFVPPAISGTIYALTLQPNNRILLGGSFTGPGLPNNQGRLLTTGAADATFAGTAVPNGIVRSQLIQPDGAIVLGGSFTQVGGTAAQALARIMAPNVLTVAAPKAVAERTAAWPVPARGLLHVAPDPTAHAQSLELVDMLGRPVRHENVAGRGPTTVSVETLPAGIYLLRVNYAEGVVTRRVQVQ